MRKLVLFAFYILIFFIEINAQKTRKLYSITPTITDLKIGKDGLVKPIIPGTFSIMLSAFGPSYCFGDPGVLSTKKFFFNFFDYKLLDTRFTYSLGLRHIFPNNIGVKATVYYGTFRGTDEGSLYPNRGYSFKTTVKEFSLHAEYIFLGGPNYKRLTPHTMYAFAGAGIMNSNAVLLYKENPISSPPNKERENDQIQLVTTAPLIPLGLGYQYRLSRRFTVGAEFVYQSVFSDFVDGISTKGSKSNDAFSSLSLTVSYKISENRDKNRCRCNE